MPTVTEYAPGSFSWAELGTSDAAGAKQFYGGLFGWTAMDIPMGDGSFYSMMQLSGQTVCALFERGQEQKEQGVPSHWMCYVTVASAEEAAAKAAALGGTVLRPAFDVMTVGRMAVVQDPLGAAVALWQPGSHQGADVVGEPGTVCWNELATTDPATAATFYDALFGWTAETMEGGPIPYTRFKGHDDALAAGMLRISEEMGNVPPHWLPYFAVADCRAAAGQAQGLGAHVHKQPTTIPGTGIFAVLADPQGAVFAIIQLETPGSAGAL